MSKRERRISREILISMTNLMDSMKNAENDLAEDDLTGLSENLSKVEQLASKLRLEIEARHGASRKK
jgi:hypothetical protein